eukprot:NODE_353_length_8928_cov_0.455204.p5 type:complete len:226 gc:universal NODE_353_length_8928_cov_0.455204:6184-6861(+)
MLLVSILLALNEYMAPKPTDVRGPCPFLNLLSNHGILNRSGRDLDLVKIKEAVVQEANVDGFLIDQVLNVVKPYAAVSEEGVETIDWSVLGKHDILEFDVSLTREDAAEGDPINLSKALYDQLVEFAEDGYLTLDGIIKARNKRLNQSRMRDGFVELSTTAKTAHFANSVLIAGTLGRDYKIKLEHLEIFLLEERFPEDWERRPKMLGKLEFANRALQCWRGYDQ